MQSPPQNRPDTPWNRPTPDQTGAAAPAPTLGLPPAFRAFALDELTRAVLVLLIVSALAIIVLTGIVRTLIPAGLPAVGAPPPAAHAHPSFVDTPSRAQTNGKGLNLTLHATGTTVDVGYRATRYVFTVDPPNDPPFTLCDGATPLCPLPLDGSRRQAGTWVIHLEVFDNTGASAETRTRLRVT